MFSRICNNRGKFPVKLSEHLQRDKLDLFNQWLEAGKNMDEFLDFTMPSNLDELAFEMWMKVWYQRFYHSIHASLV
jgi:hypothetical protein